ncbi:MAG: hydroxyacylglutathione hydrolase [Sphingomonadaceae bacterium]|uniref:hydroxyacylglutathione hydrolase n=1 Tax=Thermaurantiacus sp. TaxID=2820283 RepID=UPI00298EE639|nr:hydroxyacylglutathione hydrolase [Thermaurantiacus sp.]MCS6987410.1 hydroxyacylglutathione hydrolase [Sphingomonadaceae bacterium]MDW8415330.1 hydroxyacylglutathione hydrolase [Thermaurantiacus sp.]
MPEVFVHRVPALADNYIWLFEYAPGFAAVVDPAVADPVLEAARRLGLRLTHILNTHWHPDHVGGNDRIKAASGCQVVGPAREAGRIPGLDRAVDEGDVVRLGDHDGHVLFVGAHTAGHVAYHFPSADALFCGDTLFAMGCGRLFEGTAQDLFAALGKLSALPPETRVFCAHEYTLANARFALSVEPDNAPLKARYRQVQEQRARGEATVPFRLAEELATNPFLRAGTVEELAERRRAKDVFRG